jgi:hypothetical protein
MGPSAQPINPNRNVVGDHYFLKVEPADTKSLSPPNPA